MNNETLRERLKSKDFKDIENWDVSKVTDMGIMFYNAKAFNQDISNWDVGKVTKMNHMFFNAELFNQDISNWDVSNVTDMYKMFSCASKSFKCYNAWQEWQSKYNKGEIK